MAQINTKTVMGKRDAAIISLGATTGLRAVDSLRRHLAKNLIVSGVPVTTIAQILGHQSMESVKQYLSLDGQNLKERALDFSAIPLAREGVVM
ncbi:tyrosine-type recombinase/integrase [Caproicibacter fermentans]|nr:tyrosine-type recombinase/integrase [Caproicibacter fermentans]